VSAGGEMGRCLALMEGLGGGHSVWGCGRVGVKTHSCYRLGRVPPRPGAVTMSEGIDPKRTPIRGHVRIVTPRHRRSDLATISASRTLIVHRR
jgi:hypothetical protein